MAQPRDNEKFEKFLIWYSLPEFLKGMKPETIQEKYGLKDPEALELFQYRTMKAFAEKFVVHPDTLTDWVKIIKEKRLDRIYRKTDLFRGATSNVILALYKKAMETGNRQEVEYYLDYTGEHTSTTNLNVNEQEAQKTEEDYESVKASLAKEEADASALSNRIAAARKRVAGEAGTNSGTKKSGKSKAGRGANREASIEDT